MSQARQHNNRRIPLCSGLARVKLQGVECSPPVVDSAAVRATYIMIASMSHGEINVVRAFTFQFYIYSVFPFMSIFLLHFHCAVAFLEVLFLKILPDIWLTLLIAHSFIS